MTPGSPDVCGSCPCTAPPGLAIALGPLRRGTGGGTVKTLREGGIMSSGRAQYVSSFLVLSCGTPRGARLLPPCPHGAQPALPFLPLLCRGVLCRADAPLLLRLTDVR